MREPRLPSMRLGLFVLGTIACFGNPASGQTPAPGGGANRPAETRAQQPTPTLSRWVDLQAASFGGRYRVIENSAGDRTANQAQYQTSIKAALRIDEAGRVLVTGAFATGSSGTSSWNSTGVGTGQGTRQHSLKELFVTVAPAKGLAIHAGSMAFARGLSTEATTWDNDFYVMGERVTVKRPQALYFDEVTATFGYVGDLSTPSVFSRWERLGDSNYRQVLVVKKAGRLQVSGDYTSHEHVGTARAAVKVSVPEFRLIDSIRYEAYAGVRGGDETGFMAHAEKSLARRLAVGGGLGDIDPAYGMLNGDRFGRGRRVYLTGSIGLPADLTVQIWATRAFANDVAVSNRTRVDAVVSYNLLSTLRRARMF